MSFPTFQALANQLGEYFQNKQFAEALDLITLEGPNFPQDRAWADYWKMCAAARLGNTSVLYQVSDKLLADGIWFGEVLWRQSPSFIPLQGDANFEKMVTAHLEAQAREGKPVTPIMHTYLPEHHSAKSPVLIALHGNQQTAFKTMPFWHPAVRKGWVVVMPQSTQAMFKGAYAWDNLEESFASVQANVAELKEQTAFDADHVVLAGHSMGGLVAIEMALRGLVSVRGFIVNGPAVPFLDAPAELDALLPAARERGLRCYFIIGEKDEDINREEVKALVEKLKSAGLACELESVPGAMHDHVPAYDAALLRALDFVGSPGA